MVDMAATRMCRITSLHGAIGYLGCCAACCWRLGGWLLEDVVDVVVVVVVLGDMGSEPRLVASLSSDEVRVAGMWRCGACTCAGERANGQMNAVMNERGRHR